MTHTSLLTLAHQIGLCAIIVVGIAAMRRVSSAWHRPAQQVVTGSVFGVGAALAMMVPLTQEPGVQIDIRNVVIALSGPFGGPVAAVVSTLVAALCRMWLGGLGVMPALVGMTASALAGVWLGAQARRAGRPLGPGSLSALGLAVSIITLASFLLLPLDVGWTTIQVFWVPIVVSDVLGGILLGLVLLEEQRRRNLHQTVTATNERLNAITNNVADGVVTINALGVVETFNASAERIFGYKAREVIGRNVKLLMPEPYCGEHDGYLARYLQTGEARVIGIGREVVGLRKDGSTFPMELRIATFHIAGQQLFTASVRDITEQKRTAAALEASEAQYRLLAETTSDMIVRADTSARRLYVSPGCHDVLGFRPDELIGTVPEDFVHPEDAAELHRKLLALGAGELDEATNTHRFRHKAGHWVWIEVKFRLVRTGSGEPREVVSILRDISERHRQAEALRSAKEEAERVADSLRLRDRSLEAIGQGVIITDAQKPDCPIIYVNPAFERLTGYAEEEVLGRNCRFLQGPETDASAVMRIQGALRSGKGTTETLLNYRRDGSTFINELVISPVHADDGSLCHFVGIQSDVTRRVEMEAHLRQSQKIEAMGQLTGGVAHDFNNLLTVVIGNTEMLAEAVAEPHLKELAQQVQDAAERGADLTQKLLAFGRRQSLKPIPLGIGHVVTGMTPLLRRTLSEHIELQTDVRSDAFTLADRTLLESALLNLVVNARDAMPQGGTLTISSGCRLAGPDDGELPSGQPVVFITVSDTGAGMTPEVQARVFEPFFTTKEIGKGSGLGLSMVYGFAQQSGGHVSIESTTGRGTSVTILLREIETPAAHAPERANEAAPRGKERVLVVEDEPPLLQFVSAQLVNLGYEVTAVPTAIDALDVLASGKPFDLLFTDVVLPKGMSGVELARRALNLRPRLRTLLTSGYPEDAFEQHGRPIPDMPLLRKPYRRAELARALKAALGERTLSEPLDHGSLRTVEQELA